MLRHIEVNNSPSIVCQNEEDKQHFERRAFEIACCGRLLCGAELEYLGTITLDQQVDRDQE